MHGLKSQKFKKNVKSKNETLIIVFFKDNFKIKC